MFVIDMISSANLPSGYVLASTLLAIVGPPLKPLKPKKRSQELTLPPQLLLYQTTQTLYNLYFHPLASFPGPLSQRASKLPWALQHVLGTEAFETHKLHVQYGPIVRIAPNHLAFTDPRAWRDIYGHLVGAKHGQPEMQKSHTFSKAIDDIPTSILNAPREEHSRFRRALSHGFSDASMRLQEPVVLKYVDLLMKRLHEASASGKKINAEAYYNWTTFDITGELVFGMSFGSLNSSKYHPWIEFIIAAVRGGAWLTTMSYIGLHWLVQAIYRFAGATLALAKTEKVINEMLTNRLEKVEKGRADLFEGLVKHREEWGISFEQLASNAFILTLAGSETTATTLSGVTYLLLSHPEVLERVKREVRGKFGGVEEIDIASVGRLEYMLAVLNESLRMFPPVVSGLVRVVPEGGAVIAGGFVPGGVSGFFSLLRGMRLF